SRDMKRRHRINRRTRLGDEHRQLMWLNDGIPIAVLASKIDFDGYARHALDHELAGESCMPAGSTRCDIDFTQLLHFRVADSRSRQRNMTRAVDAHLDGFTHRLGLLIDLLEHVVGKTIFVGLWCLIDHEVSILAKVEALPFCHLPTDHRVNNLALRREQNQIGIASNSKLSLAIHTNQLRGIPRSKNHALLQTPVCEAHHVPYGAI